MDEAAAEAGTGAVTKPGGEVETPGEDVSASTRVESSGENVQAPSHGPAQEAEPSTPSEPTAESVAANTTGEIEASGAPQAATNWSRRIGRQGYHPGRRSGIGRRAEGRRGE